MHNNVDPSDPVLDFVGMVVVTDAEDVFDKGNSDTPSYGSQKSLAFLADHMREILQLLLQYSTGYVKQTIKPKVKVEEFLQICPKTGPAPLQQAGRISRWPTGHEAFAVQNQSDAKDSPLRTTCAFSTAQKTGVTGVFSKETRITEDFWSPWDREAAVQLTVFNPDKEEKINVKTVMKKFMCR